MTRPALPPSPVVVKFDSAIPAVWHADCRNVWRFWLLGVILLRMLGHAWNALTEGVKPFDWLLFFIEFAIVALIVYEIWGQPFFERRARERTLSKTFELLPEETRIPASANERMISIVVRVLQPTDLRHFNIRFVAGPDGGNISPSVIQVTSATCDPTHADRQIDFKIDGEGGCHCEWCATSAHRSLFYAGRGLKIWICVIARTPWSGYLSFQGYDVDGQRRFARHTFTVE